jgi:hypothetical protein
MAWCRERCALIGILWAAAGENAVTNFFYFIKSHIFRRVEPPTGQISNVLANQQISSVKESKDLFSYLSHHGERSNEPVPICDHSRKHFDWEPCEPTDWRIKPRRPRPVPVEHGQGKRMYGFSFLDCLGFRVVCALSSSD